MTDRTAMAAGTAKTAWSGAQARRAARCCRAKLQTTRVLFALSAVLAVLPSCRLAAQVSRTFRFTTTEKYDPATVPAYRGRHQAIYRHIDANLEDHVAQIQRWLRQPSVSAQNVGIARWRRWSAMI